MREIHTMTGDHLAAVPKKRASTATTAMEKPTLMRARSMCRNDGKHNLERKYPGMNKTSMIPMNVRNVSIISEH